jgi:DNA-binding NtrC family response regulator
MLMTGMDGGQYARRALEMGVFRFLTKPIKFDQLDALVQEALRHHARLDKLSRNRGPS